MATYTSAFSGTQVDQAITKINSSITGVNYGEVALKYADSKLYFKDSSNIIQLVSIDASILSGTTLNSSVVTSSLTNVGTLTSLTTSGKVSVTYQPVTTVGSAIEITANGTQGGTSYADFLKATTSVAGATNPSKYFRLTNVGTLEILNSAYNTPILSLTDGGTLNISSSIQVGGKQAINGPAFSVYRNTAQTIATDVQTKISWDTEEYDTNNNFTSDRFTPTISGYYSLTASVRFDSGIGTGERMIVIYKNGSEYKRGFNTKGSAAVGDSWFQMSINCQAYANGSTDYFEVYAMHGAGANRTTTAGQQFTFFQGCMMRGA